MPKRTLTAVDDEAQATPRKRHHSSQPQQSEDLDEGEIIVATPTLKSSRNAIEDPSATNNATLSQSLQSIAGRARRNDKSARKKSAAVLDAGVNDEDDTADDIELSIAQSILDDDDADSGDDQAEPGAEPETNHIEAVEPVKRPRGRPKGRKKDRTPTPPPDLPAHELYFFHNRTTASQTSANTLPAHALLNHDDYLAQIKAYDDPHAHDIQRLMQLHYRSFEQWQFELDGGYSLCLYGMGSKRNLIMDFVDHLHETSTKKIVVANGYNSSLSIKDILNTVADIIFQEETPLPGQPIALLETVTRQLSKVKTKILLVIHNLDSVGLRKAATQAIIARLASLPQISLLASCDNLNFSLLWDLSLLKHFNFVYHDATTFMPWTVEIDAVEEVNTLLGRNSRRLAGKDGVGYVLRSLPENARNLFRILVAEQLALGDIDFSSHNGHTVEDDDLLGASDEELAARHQNTPSKRGRGRPKKSHVKAAPIEGIEYRTLYHKAVEEFVCSSEVAFRTLLKEFHDHQMIESRKDSMGTERLIVPFRTEELEAILMEL